MSFNTLLKITSLAVFSFLLSACQTRPSNAVADGITYVDGGDKNLINIQLINPIKTNAKKMVVFLHGDVSSGGNADYFKKRISEYKLDDGTMSVVLMRPGYCSSTGCSDGSHNGRRDHYTKENITMVANAIEDLKKRYKPQKTVIVGHSGGSATAGVIMGMYPNIADGSVLLACPCNISRWRDMRGKSSWSNSLSPIDYIKGLSPKARIVLLNGSSDDNTQTVLAEEYVAKASNRNVTSEEIEGANHRTVVRQYRKIAEAIERVSQ